MSDPPQNQEHHSGQPDPELEALIAWGQSCLSEQADRVEQVINTFHDPSLKEWVLAEVAARLILKHPILTPGSFDASVRTQLILTQQRNTKPWTASTATKASVGPTPA